MNGFCPQGPRRGTLSNESHIVPPRYFQRNQGNPLVEKQGIAPQNTHLRGKNLNPWIMELAAPSDSDLNDSFDS